MFDKTTWQREYRRKHGNGHTHKYEKTPNGFLMRLYRNMQSRVTGVQAKKAHLYRGLPILPREDFYAWAKAHPDFAQMFEEWKTAGYSRKLTPTVDRINSAEGYTLSNMRWLTHSVNSSRRMNA